MNRPCRTRSPRIAVVRHVHMLSSLVPSNVLGCERRASTARLLPISTFMPNLDVARKTDFPRTAVAPLSTETVAADGRMRRYFAIIADLAIEPDDPACMTVRAPSLRGFRSRHVRRSAAVCR